MSLSSAVSKLFVQIFEKLPNLLILLGVILIGFSYCKIENSKFQFPISEPNFFFLALGATFIIGGIATHVVFSENRITKLKDGMSFKVNSCTVTIKQGPLQDADHLTSDSAFVLPANNTFADDCVTDTKSALGAFFNKHHPEKIPEFKDRIKKILSQNLIFAGKNNLYDPATACILPEEYSIRSKVILIASSIRDGGKGFHTTPSIISDSIYNLFEKTSDKRINTFFFPIIGSGHGGLEVTEALNLMVLLIKFHTRKFHHVKNIFIFVLENDSKKIKANFLKSLEK